MDIPLGGIARLAIAVSLFLAGCGSTPTATTLVTESPESTSTPTITLPPTVTVTLTPTPHPTESPTPLVSSTPTPLLPTPALPLASAGEFPFSKFFFDNGDYPGCDLPCWKGLRIGQPGSEQVQHMFDTEFGFNGRLNFRTDTPLGDLDLSFMGIDSLPGDYVMGYAWANRPVGQFLIGAAVNHDTDLFEGLAFTWTVDQAPSFHIGISPQDFLQQLGTPDQMLASISNSEVNYIGSVELIMTYDQGIILEWISTVPMIVSNGSSMAKFCLAKSTVDAGTGLIGEIYITGSLPNDPSELSTFQKSIQAHINRMINIRGLEPFVDVFGITPQDATELALKGGDNCIYSK